MFLPQCLRTLILIWLCRLLSLPLWERLASAALLPDDWLVQCAKDKFNHIIVYCYSDCYSCVFIRCCMKVYMTMLWRGSLKLTSRSASVTPGTVSSVIITHNCNTVCMYMHRHKFVRACVCVCTLKN